jgi:hypothetical protein
MQMTSEIIFKIAPITIACFSLLIALRSIWIAKNALVISRKQYEDKLPEFDIYYHNGFRFNNNKEDIVKKLLLFQLTIKNKAEFRNTFKADLSIKYLRLDDSFSELNVEHNPKIQANSAIEELSLFPIDIVLEAKTSSTKWLIFEQPILLDNSHRIENYEIKITDVNGNKCSIETVIIKDI